MKAVLISGSFKKIDIPQNIINFINNNIDEGKNISFIASNFNEFNTNDYFVEKLLKEFKIKNLIFKNI